MEIEWWEEREDYCPGISVWKGTPIELHSSSESDAEPAEGSLCGNPSIAAKVVLQAIVRFSMNH